MQGISLKEPSSNIICCISATFLLNYIKIPKSPERNTRMEGILSRKLTEYGIIHRARLPQEHKRLLLIINNLLYTIRSPARFIILSDSKKNDAAS